MTSPKLRFKEFGGCWENTSFQSLFTFKNGINASKEQYGSGTKFINVLDIINNPNGITYDSIIGSVQVFQKDIDKNLVNYGDVVFQRSSETREEVGQSNVYLSKEPVVFGGFVIRGSARVPYDPLFMNGLLKTDKVRDQITQLSGGSTRFNIGQDSLNKVSVFLPSKEEQTKIASFLSAVDEKISQLSQKHQLLSQYKQGMMQKLFSQQIRFKADDGSEFGEWEDKKIGDIFKVTSGSTPLRSDERYFKNAEIFWVKTTDLNNGLITKTEEKISKVALEETSIKVLPKGTVFVAMYGGFNQIGRTGLLTMESACNQALSAIYPNQLVNPYFLLTYLNFKVEDWKSFAASSRKDPNITKSDVLAFPFILMSLEEQTKIAHFLSAIDQKIEVIAQQIEQAKTWKKGLLQQMFV